MIAIDPIVLEFYQGNVITISILLSAAGSALKLLAVLSKNPSNKTLDFLSGLVESGKNRL
ncbi:hypothetical protein LCGC14_2591410, partial [marine sediment metagenome]